MPPIDPIEEPKLPLMLELKFMGLPDSGLPPRGEEASGVLETLLVAGDLEYLGGVA